MTREGKKQMNATMLRMVLFGMMGVIVAISAAGFIYGVTFVRTYAQQVSGKRSSAEASNNTVQTLENTKKQLNTNADVIAKANQLRADGKSNENYPEIKIINAVRQLASKNNLTINTITQGADTPATTTTPGGTASTPQPSTSTTGGATATTPTAASDTVSIAVAMTTPVNYKDYLQFLYDIEQNLPILKVDGVTVKPSENGSTDMVNAETLTIRMYIKKG